MRLNSMGNLLIGKITQGNPSYLLDVSGSVRANAVVVNTDSSDFVFEPTYKLNSLTWIPKYIKQNHHLPEIQSAKEMQTIGMNLGENQTKLLQKIEELTLYLIEKDKKEKEQEAINKALMERLNKLENKIEELTKDKN